MVIWVKRTTYRTQAIRVLYERHQCTTITGQGTSKRTTDQAASERSQQSRAASDLFPYLLRDNKLSWPTKGQGQVSGDWYMCNLHRHTVHEAVFVPGYKSVCRYRAWFSTSSGWATAIKSDEVSMPSYRTGVAHLMKNTEDINIFVVGDWYEVTNIWLTGSCAA